MSDRITLTARAALDLQAASDGDKPATLTGVAYSGGIMSVGGFGSVVLDLAGMERPATLPILSDHNSDLDGVVGNGTTTVQRNELLLAGTLSRSSEAATKIISLAKDGVRFSLSIGADPIEQRRVNFGEKIQANGRAFIAPAGGLVFISKSRLAEVSVVAIGADSRATSSIQAGATDMSTDTNIESDPIQVERERCGAIAKVAASHPAIQAKAMAENWDATKTELEVLRASRPTGPAIHLRASNPQDIGGNRRILAAALSYRIGGAESTVREFGEQSVEYARKAGLTASLLDLCRGALRLENRDVPDSKDALIRAAFSTSSLPDAISDSMHYEVKRAYLATMPSWRTFSAVRPAADFRTHGMLQPHLAGNLEELGAASEIVHSSLSSDSFEFAIDTFAKQFRATRQQIINDHVGVFADLPMAMARMAQSSVASLIYTTLLANAGSHFGSGNANYLSGGSSALSITSLEAAVLKLRRQTDASGNSIDIVPKVLLVPPELEVPGRALLVSSQVQRDTSIDRQPTGNVFQGQLDLAVEPRLSNSTFTGYSTTAWYILAGPIDVPFVTAFLDGQESPTVEFFGLDSDSNTLGVSWRVFLDYGAALGDYKAAVKSAGA